MRHVALISALLGLSFVQCSSTDKKGPKYPDPTSFCDNLAKAECSDAVVKECLVSSKDVCAAQRQTVCKSTYVTPAQSEGLTYDAPQAETCVNAVLSAYSDITITSDEMQSIASKCGSVFSRMGAKNASCSVDSDCKSSDGLQCVIHLAAQSGADAGAEGTCQVPSPQKGGSSCSLPDATCETGYHCGSTSHCDQDEVKGNACSAIDPCATAFKCTAGKCVDKLAISAVCTTDEDCASGICLTSVNPNLCADSVTLSPPDPFCADMRN